MCTNISEGLRPPGVSLLILCPLFLLRWSLVVLKSASWPGLLGQSQPQSSAGRPFPALTTSTHHHACLYLHGFRGLDACPASTLFAELPPQSECFYLLNANTLSVYVGLGARTAADKPIIS